MLYPAKKGAYTELFAGLSETITEQNNAGWGKSAPNQESAFLNEKK